MLNISGFDKLTLFPSTRPEAGSPLFVKEGPGVSSHASAQRLFTQPNIGLLRKFVSLFTHRSNKTLTVYDGKLIAGGHFTTAGAKVAPYVAAWKKKGFDAVTEQSSLPATVQLSQNHPNPFNPSTTIDFSIPTDSRVTLTICNITGQKVAAPKNELMPAGRHSVVWNAAGMPSGMYFCTVKAGDFAETSKMMLIK